MQRLALVLALSVFLISGFTVSGSPAHAKSEKAQNHPHGDEHADRPGTPSGGFLDDLDVHVVITSGDIGVLRDYYREHTYEPASLPPGIAKNLARGKPLPPGIAKRYVAAPLHDRLSPRPDCDWMLVGPHVVLVARDTGIVVDIAFDVF